jgi:hypothetical protein
MASQEEEQQCEEVVEQNHHNTRNHSKNSIMASPLVTRHKAWDDNPTAKNQCSTAEKHGTTTQLLKTNAIAEKHGTTTPLLKTNATLEKHGTDTHPLKTNDQNGTLPHRSKALVQLPATSPEKRIHLMVRGLDQLSPQATSPKKRIRLMAAGEGTQPTESASNFTRKRIRLMVRGLD